MPLTLLACAPVCADADSADTGFVEWATDRGISLYSAQDEAVIELVCGANVMLSTPTGTGKSLVAVAAHASCLARGGRTYYTAPIQRLRSTTGQRRRKPARVGGVAATLHQPGPTPDWMPVGELIVASFTARMSDLPAPTRRLLLAAALGNDVPLGETCREAHLCASSSPERVAM